MNETPFLHPIVPKIKSSFPSRANYLVHDWLGRKGCTMRQRAVHISRAWLLVLAAVFIGLAAIYLNGSGESRTQSDGPAQPSGESPEASRTELDLAAYPAQPPAPRPDECGTATLSDADGAWVVDWLED